MEKKKVGSVEYHEAGAEYFAKRQLCKHARIWSLWALGVGAAISGHFSGWNFGLGTGGFGGLFHAAIIIGVMSVCLCLCSAEKPATLPHTRAACRGGTIGVAVWYAAGIIYFAVYGRRTLVSSPERDFAVRALLAAGLDRA